MTARSLPLVSRLANSLSVRLLVLTIGFVMLSEVLIFVPSIARYRVSWLESRLDNAHLASLPLLELPGHMVSKGLARELLADVGAEAVVLKLPKIHYLLMLGGEMPPRVDATVDLRHQSAWEEIRDALAVLVRSRDRVLRVVAQAPMRRDSTVEVVMHEAPLRAAMLDYAGRIFSLSLLISLVTAGLVYASLQWLLVRPMRRITASMTVFREAPEDATRVIVPSRRHDEIGRAERELAQMQHELRQALQQKSRLAALGAAVAKVNHDLRNILATAELVSDRMVSSEDPLVRRVAPRVVAAIDRAIALCTSTLRYGRADEPAPERRRFPLTGLLDEVAAAIGLPQDGSIRFETRVAEGLSLEADREQIFRVLLNLGRNAVQAISGEGFVRVTAVNLPGRVEIGVEDSGTGLPAAAQAHLFEAFVGAARAGGTGLGLAIARDLVRAHGGEIELARTGPEGSLFRLWLPEHPPSGSAGAKGKR